MYDFIAWLVSAGRWNEWGLAVLPHLTGSQILELGHGPGHLQLALNIAGYNAVGIDQSIQMGRLAAKRLTQYGNQHQLIRGQCQALPFSDMVFNTVVAAFPTSYIFDKSSITEIYRVLRPGGKLIFMPAAWITSTRLLDRLAASIFRITGQAPQWDEEFSTPYLKAGFRVHVDTIETRSSQVLLVTAEKPATIIGIS